MRVVMLSALLSGAVMVSTAAWAQPAAAPGEGVEYLAGRWSASAEDPATKEVLVVDYRVERTGAGTWLAGRAASADGAVNSRDMWGRDPLTNEIVRVIFDAGAFATIRSPGWAGDRLVLEGDVRSKGGTLRVRETITRLGPDRFRAVWEALRDGKWAPYSIETVTRRS